MKLSASLAALAIALAGCAGTPSNDGGRREAGAGPLVMSVNPCIDAILEQVADPAQVVSVSHYSQDPRATSSSLGWARQFPANGGTAEEVIAAGPDIVLLGPHVGRSTTRAIEKAGIAIAEIPVPSSVEESLAQIRAVASAAGHTDRGEALVGRIEKALGAAAPRSGEPVEAIIWQGGGLVPGAGTLADEMLRRTGYRNKSASFGLAAWDILPAERLLVDPPQVVFRSEQSERGPGARGGRSAQRLEQIARTVPFPDRLLYCAGPNLIELAGFLSRQRDAAMAASGATAS